MTTRAEMAYPDEPVGGPKQIESHRAVVTPISDEVWMRYANALTQWIAYDDDTELNQLTDEHPELLDHINISGGLPYET